MNQRNANANESFETHFLDETGFRTALDTVIAVANREIRIVDDRLERMRLDDAARAESLAQFLAAAPMRRLHIILHDPQYAETRSPRLHALIRRFPNSIEVRESSAEFKHVADCFLLADGIHGAIRFHRNHARGKMLRNAADGIHPWWQRFEELWRSATPCLAPTQIGL
ncbi:conserved protein of unknown function [Georgfuchsia toluolica]|uniref:DUF7931 domain-containing protein n=1 Tax=Georgfuchsia toluolica TaxID=424218 RepID=A0A916J2W2_9PROT|nr:hypothetical protein [Georgfuchsia toluolica]CAG4882974.1 conserved protein of unknown function [Georgfuchsia toluolica]